MLTLARAVRLGCDSSLKQHPAEKALRGGSVGAGSVRFDGVAASTVVELSGELTQQLGALVFDESEESLRGRVFLERRYRAVEAEGF